MCRFWSPVHWHVNPTGKCQQVHPTACYLSCSHGSSAAFLLCCQVTCTWTPLGIEKAEMGTGPPGASVAIFFFSLFLCTFCDVAATLAVSPFKGAFIVFNRALHILSAQFCGAGPWVEKRTRGRRLQALSYRGLAVRERDTLLAFVSHPWPSAWAPCGKRGMEHALELTRPLQPAGP